MIEFFIVMCHVEYGCMTPLDKATQTAHPFSWEECHEIGDKLIEEEAAQVYKCVDEETLLEAMPGVKMRTKT